MALSGAQLIFNEVVQALEPQVQNHVTYVQLLRQAHRLSKENDLTGLLDLLDTLACSPSVVEQPPSDVETVLSAELDDVTPPSTSATAPIRRRGTTTAIRFSRPQREILRHHFYVIKDYWPSLYLRNVLAKMFNVTSRSVYFWFANERRLKNITRVDTPVLLSHEDERRLLLQYRVQAGRPTMVIP
jgi:hypothetical protein